MTTQNDRFRQRVDRLHDDLFGGSRYQADFYNHIGGSYNPDTGEITGETKELIARWQVELVPPGMDSTVNVDGTSFSWDTSIRFPQSQGDRIYTTDTTIPSGEIVTFDSVTVESGVTLTVNGTLITGDFQNNGTVYNNNTVIVLTADSVSNALEGDRIYTTDTTIQSGEIVTFDSVTVESGVTLTVNGTLITGDFQNNGTVDNNNTVIVLTAESVLNALVPLGEDNQRPTEIEINDPTETDTTTYELHSFASETGSGMLMCRVVEQ